MSNKTIGRLIGCLRREKGMTQQELADLLSVSNKAVSRWERDESMPDLSLIPQIADIFGITADELLRGERKESPTVSVLSPDQITQPVNSVMTKFATRCFISGCLIGVGLLTALVCNFAFLQGILGFLAGGAVFVIAMACQACFGVSAFSALSHNYNHQRKQVFSTSCIAAAICLTLWAFCLPMIFVPAKAAIALPSLLLYGSVCAAGMALLCVMIYRLADRTAQNKGLYTLNENQKLQQVHREQTFKSWFTVTVYGLLTILIAHLFFDLFAEPVAFAKPLTFRDVDSFVEFIETPVTMEGHAQLDTDITYYDEHGNEISAEEALSREIRDDKGRVVGRYLHLNESITRITYSWTDGKPVFNLYTFDSMQKGFKTIQTVNSFFIAAYYIWTAVVAICYFVSKKCRPVK